MEKTIEELKREIVSNQLADGKIIEQLNIKIKELEEIIAKPVLPIPRTEEHTHINIECFHAYENEVCIAGTDEAGDYMSIWFDSYRFVSYIDIKHKKKH